ncbi:MAG TPA: hypothetical protein VM733_08865 [Thermoanaerobaculia bacterium]|nr:hypothetical protein [Thermoanaerobaculia bacterium]
MNDTAHLRAKALEQMDAARRNFLLAFYGAVIFEGLFTIGILWFADWKNPLHMLILCCTGVIYMPVILGLVALGAYVNRSVLRVLARLDES